VLVCLIFDCCCFLVLSIDTSASDCLDDCPLCRVGRKKPTHSLTRLLRESFAGDPHAWLLRNSRAGTLGRQNFTLKSVPSLGLFFAGRYSTVTEAVRVYCIIGGPIVTKQFRRTNAVFLDLQPRS